MTAHHTPREILHARTLLTGAQDTLEYMQWQERLPVERRAVPVAAYQADLRAALEQIVLALEPFSRENFPASGGESQQ